ncbi:twin-arginine translocase subunit TatC [Tepidibacillus fermentans]|uniref:Sec-independent protein translocase protein TatC n=1 Tax=Tepidibacillus fermentans TaxID=1281767 RepID=A0A4R3K973_9BACI|nr:twin-arginine translocase subunit TatC [Tepidibacillus fermentans]TCS79564.1 Sec-independent protein translocase TatC [Tepidibacillus fermentans]
MEEKDQAMTVIGHLEELRKRIIWTIIFFVISLIVGFVLADPVIRYFTHDLNAKNITWNVFRLSDALRVYMQFAFAIGITLSLPFALFQVWRFISPGLTKREKKATIWFIPTAFILFLLGVSFAYFILFPMVVTFLSNLSKQLGVVEVYGISQYFSFMLNIVLPFGLLFELPVVVLFLTRLGIVTPKLLIRIRKIAYFILVIVAVTLTPPEPMSDILVSIPLILLYEVSIFLSKLASKRRQQALEEI